VAGAQEEHRSRDRRPPQRGDEAQAVEPRQHHVDDGGVVGRRPPRELQTVDAVVGHVDGVAFLPQSRGDERGDAAIVFHHQDAHAAIVVRSADGRQEGVGTRPDFRTAMLGLAVALSTAVPVVAQSETIAIRGHAQTLRLYGERGGLPVIVSSGDGGWIHLGPHVAEMLAARASSSLAST
jgi:hypothetical protein